jgi:hypothetical protein
MLAVLACLVSTLRVPTKLGNTSNYTVVFLFLRYQNPSSDVAYKGILQLKTKGF